MIGSVGAHVAKHRQITRVQNATRLSIGDRRLQPPPPTQSFLARPANPRFWGGRSVVPSSRPRVLWRGRRTQVSGQAVPHYLRADPEFPGEAGKPKFLGEPSCFPPCSTRVSWHGKLTQVSGDPWLTFFNNRYIRRVIYCKECVRRVFEYNKCIGRVFEGNRRVRYVYERGGHVNRVYNHWKC